MYFNTVFDNILLLKVADYYQIHINKKTTYTIFHDLSFNRWELDRHVLFSLNTRAHRDALLCPFVKNTL